LTKGWYPDILNNELSRSNGLRKDRWTKEEEEEEEEEEAEEEEEEEDNDYNEDNNYDNDGVVEVNVDNECLGSVSKLAHCIKYPEALIVFFPILFMKMWEYNFDFGYENPAPYLFLFYYYCPANISQYILREMLNKLEEQLNAANLTLSEH